MDHMFDTLKLFLSRLLLMVGACLLQLVINLVMFLLRN